MNQLDLAVGEKHLGLGSVRTKLLIRSQDLFESLELGIWILFVICYLELGIYIFKGSIFFRNSVRSY